MNATTVVPGARSAQEGRKMVNAVHGVLTGPWTIKTRGPDKGRTLHRGQSICGYDGPFDPPDETLFGTPMTCGLCVVTVRVEEIPYWDGAL